jgi:hypothetical protein
MTDDLVKRLRAPTEHEAWLWSVPYQAADRIEKLEAALIDILKVPRSEASWGIALVIARKALEKKDALDR